MTPSVSKIYHISDVHIRNLKRHTEYRAVFKKLYSYIKKTKDSNSIIFVTGDMVHAKTEMSPEATAMQVDFYRSLADICPTFMITGNHDCNLNNTHRLDAIEPVVNALNHPNLHYWKHTGVYEYGGIMFSVMSVFDTKDKYILANDMPVGYKIALYHGTVDGAQTEVGFEIKHGSLPIKTFNGFDLTLLGDIHKPNQSLQEYGFDEIFVDPEDVSEYISAGWEIVKDS